MINTDGMTFITGERERFQKQRKPEAAGKPWTKQDDAKLWRLCAIRKQSRADAAKIMGRSYSAVTHRIKLLRLRERLKEQPIIPQDFLYKMPVPTTIERGYLK